MSSEQESLADFVRRVIRDKGLTYRKVASRSGGKITSATVSDIVNRKYTNVTTRTVAALAAGLQVSQEEVLARATGRKVVVPEGFDESMFARLYERYQHLQGEEKEFVEKNLAMLEAWINNRIEGKQANRA